MSASVVARKLQGLWIFIHSTFVLRARLGSGAAEVPAARSAAAALPQRPDADEATKSPAPASAVCPEPGHGLAEPASADGAGPMPGAAAHAGPQGSEVATEAGRPGAGAAADAGTAGDSAGGWEPVERPLEAPAGHAGHADVAQLETLLDPEAAAEEGEQPLRDALVPLVAGLRRTGKLPAALAASRDCAVAEVKQVRSVVRMHGLGSYAARAVPLLRLLILAEQHS